jgi:hypothetical protein
LVLLYCVVTLTIAHLLRDGHISLEDGARLALLGTVIVYLAVGVDVIYKLVRHRRDDDAYQWQLPLVTRIAIVAGWMFVALVIVGATHSAALALLTVVPLLPAMLVIDRYVKSRRQGIPHANE